MSPQEHRTVTSRPDSDFLWGASAIARFLGCSERRVYQAYKNRDLPIGKKAGTLVALKSALREQIEAA